MKTTTRLAALALVKTAISHCDDARKRGDTESAADSQAYDALVDAESALEDALLEESA